MPPSSKAADGRRKSGGKASYVITLSLSPSKLREAVNAEPTAEDSPAKESQESQDVDGSQDVKISKESPSPSTTAAAASNGNANGENASDSNAATPAAEGTPASMGPPVDGRKKKGVKRSAVNNDGIPKPRGKPGPKKKPRLEDGSIDPASITNRAAHKLGPKANQGAINAGLRALDRSGKPCRKWAKGGFRLKTFTGVVWEIPRWTAPPKKIAEDGTEESNAPSADNSSSKENKDMVVPEGNSVDNSNNGADVEMQSAPSIPASSPAPLAVATAS